MKSLLSWEDLLLGGTRSLKSWQKMFTALFRGKLSPPEMKAFLLLLTHRQEGPVEMMSCLKVLRKLEPPRRIARPFLIDVCGTGGDGAKTFNISTISSFVIAGAGGYVAKHGNRAVSSKAGSSDLMEALGVHLDLPFPRMIRALSKLHFGYFHAPFYHPSFLNVQSVRKELGVRTILNALGPLINPVELRYQMIGVSNPAWLEPMARALAMMRRRRAVVLRSKEGMDELSTEMPSDILYVEGPCIRRMRLDPKKLGFAGADRKDWEGGDLKTNCDIAWGILKGRMGGPREDIVLLNSGFALWLMEMASTLEEGIEKSRWVIRTGRALQVLEALRQYSRQRN